MSADTNDFLCYFLLSRMMNRPIKTYFIIRLSGQSQPKCRYVYFCIHVMDVEFGIGVYDFGEQRRFKGSTGEAKGSTLGQCRGLVGGSLKWLSLSQLKLPSCFVVT